MTNTPNFERIVRAVRHEEPDRIPLIEVLVEYPIHDKGRLFFYHSDGDMRPIMEDMISIGVDALHPIDPTALDIARMKETYGGRIALFGNVSTELLRSGTPDEVRETVKELLRTVAPGGGYCLGSGNSVPEWANLANYNAMRETVLQFGMYPIRVD